MTNTDYLDTGIKAGAGLATLAILRGAVRGGRISRNALRVRVRKILRGRK